MARDSHVRIRPPFADDLDLPPPFRAIALREAGNAFAHAIGVADKEGAGALVHVGRYGFAELAVVLEPAEPLRTARRVIYAGLVALTDALAAAAPPEKPIDIVWPDAIRIDAGLVGSVRLAWPAHGNEEAPPTWLVFAAVIRTATSEQDPVLPSHATALDAEGFHIGSAQLIESFARYFMVAIDAWQQDGFAAVARSYLSRLAREKGVRREIDLNGDLLVRRVGQAEVERRPLLPALTTPSWLDPETGGPHW
jgi:biotin/lipoate A/B protein ligase family protein